MLILTRKPRDYRFNPAEFIEIDLGGVTVRVSVTRIQNGRASIGVEAPDFVKVTRGELLAEPAGGAAHHV